MTLEKLLLAASLSLALAGCETEDIIKKPYRKAAKPIPKVVVDQTPIKAREGYETSRFEQGEFGIYDVTVYKPKSNLNLEAQGTLIKQLASDYNFYLKNVKRELNLELLMSEETLPISKPNFDAVDCIDKSLNSQGSDKSTKALALCSITGSSTNKLPKQYGYGVRIGANYIIVPASVIYSSIISKEIGEAQSIEFSMLSEHKNVGSGTVHKGRVLAINPIADLALVETDEKFYTGIFMPIVEEKQIEEAKLFVDKTSSSLTNVFKLNEDQLLWRLIGKENDLAKSLGYSIATIEKLSNKRGLGVYNDSGLIGLIAQDMKKYLDTEEDFQNALVIPSSQIRKFLTDYLNFVKSGSNKLETILIDSKVPIETPESKPSTSLPSTIVPAPTTSDIPIQPTEFKPEISKESKPVEPITPPFGKLFSIYTALVLSAGIIGRRYYLKNPPKSEKVKDSSGLPQRFSELEKWLEYKKYEAKIKVPKTILDVKNQETIMGFSEERLGITEGDIAHFPHKFLDWLYTLTPKELPKTYKEHVEREIKLRKEHAKKDILNRIIKTKLGSIDKQKTTLRLIKKDYQIYEEEVAKFEKERAESIERADKERADRIKKILFREENKI